jgi:hypothetical protein
MELSRFQSTGFSLNLVVQSILNLGIHQNGQRLSKLISSNSIKLKQKIRKEILARSAPIKQVPHIKVRFGEEFFYPSNYICQPKVMCLLKSLLNLLSMIIDF